MKLVTFDREDRLTAPGLLLSDRLIDLQQALPAIRPRWGPAPKTMVELLERFDEFRQVIAEHREELTQGLWYYEASTARMRAPVPWPRSFRDFYAFEQHVRAVRARQGANVLPEWYEIPVFYFSNHNAIVGPDEPIPFPPSSLCRDFELEVGAVLCRKGKNISAADAESYIAGFFILNDWTARDIQEKEVKLIGPAKGKDFATAIGPWLVTLDELEDRKTAPGKYDLVMKASVNGKPYSQANLKDIYWSFCDMIAFASRDTYVYPGEILGSGTAGTGCILELGAENTGWLRSGDVVELEIERLGVLRNTVL